MKLGKFKTRPLTPLLLFAGLFIASIAAWFSVFGIASLYAGAYLAVLLMAISLETAKLVAVSYLKIEWKFLTRGLKYIGVFFVAFLMLLTSTGIFGFLMSSYQSGTLDLERINNELRLNEEQVEILRERSNDAKLEKKNAIDNRQTELDGMVINEETRFLDNKRRREIYQKWEPDIFRADSIMMATNVRIDSIQTKIFDLKEQQLNTGADIGPLVVIANIFTDGDMNPVIKWFTLFIILIFDPLAVYLIIAFNDRVIKDRIYFKNDETNSEESSIEEEVEEKVIEVEPIDKTEEVSNSIKDIVGSYITEIPNDEEEEAPHDTERKIKLRKIYDDIIEEEKSKKEHHPNKPTSHGGIKA